jgi:FkbM family methyltransferase
MKFQAALGKEHQMIHMNEVSFNMGMNKVYQGGMIPMFLIDDLNLPTCDLIQLDCEGYEILILEGARETIRRHRPVVSVEDTNSAIEGFLSIFDYKKVNGWGRDTVYATE